jgi:cysteine desulfurase
VTVTLVTPNCDGWVNPGDYEKAITPTTRLLSLMTANNETGVIQPVQEIAAIGKHYGIPVHTDAVQALGKIPFSMKTLGVTYASFSAHKLYGPKGAGCLAINVLGEPSRSGLTSLLHGGSQESGLRSGTENVAGIVGFGAATELAEQKLKQDSARIYALRRMMADLIHTEIPGSHLVPFQAPRLPGTLCICFEEVQGTYVVLDLAEQGIAVSSGSACSSKHSTPSHVLLAMGIDETLAQGAVRFSLGRGITEEQVQWCVEMTRKVVESLRKANPS